jgi:hypothetical protein
MVTTYDAFVVNLRNIAIQIQNNSYAIAHPYFDHSYSALYDDDGVHLSFIGKDIWY